MSDEAKDKKLQDRQAEITKKGQDRQHEITKKEQDRAKQ
jgi:hypothetical protein